MKKYLLTILSFMTILIILLPYCVFATSVVENLDINKLDFSGINTNKLSDLENTIESFKNSHLSKPDEENTENGTASSSSIDTLLDFYEEISKVITNEEIVTFIDNNKNALTTIGVSKSLLSTTSTLLKNFDADTVIDVVKNDLNLEEAISTSKEGASADSIVKSALKKTSTGEKIKIAFKLIFSNGFFRLLFAFIIVISIYSVFITSYIFKKADKPGFATAIPIYRDIIHLRLCNFSPWLLILVFIPLIGWLALAAIAVVGRFELSRNFGHGFLFGLGLLFLPPVFRTYLAFSDDEFHQGE